MLPHKIKTKMQKILILFLLFMLTISCNQHLKSIDFTEEGSYKAAIAKIDYLVDLGVTAIELMPVNEFEGNDSWGYNPSFYLALDKAYGTRNAFKKFMEARNKLNFNEPFNSIEQEIKSEIKKELGILGK